MLQRIGATYAAIQKLISDNIVSMRKLEGNCNANNVDGVFSQVLTKSLGGILPVVCFHCNSNMDNIDANNCFKDIELYKEHNKRKKSDK